MTQDGVLKRENLNKTTLPELNRLIDQSDEKPFFLFLRHMDPHSPYLPPAPYERMFYHGDACDPSKQIYGTCDVIQTVLRLLCFMDAGGDYR